MNIARYEKRIFSYLIDWFLTAAPAIAGGVLLFVFYGDRMPWYFVILLIIAASWLVYSIFITLIQYLSNGHTLGSVIFGIRVVHKDLSKITFKESLLRNVNMGLLPIVIINACYMIGVHTELSIFDRISNTLSVEWRKREQ